MKLAEALVRRSDAQKRVEQLRARIKENATYQEGETLNEDPNALIKEAVAVIAGLEDLITKINQTNARATLDSGDTVTAAIARRDMLKLKHSLLTHASDAASKDRPCWGRSTRTELVTVTAVDVPDLRRRADQVAEELRRLDLEVQAANWRVELV
jgi:hypothetical protein